jgi:putative flippase GtrA
MLATGRVPSVGSVTTARVLAPLLRRYLTREVLTFLLVGGVGYVVDVGVFNWLRSIPPTDAWDPTVARTLAVVVAMCVTFVGNRTLTWRDHTTRGQGREIALFVLFNIVGFSFSVLTLFISHDLLHLTSRLADNVSANVIGLALGTAFRFVTYKYVVFVVDLADQRPRDGADDRAPGARASRPSARPR